MIYRKQKDYDSFKCIADKCPKSCCIGWQIMIDEDSLFRYQEVTGDFSSRLADSIDYKESSFRQHNTRCSMLNDNGLCDLQSTLGDDYLCDTCRLYPRHTEEFQDIREYSLSLSCPEAVRMLLEPDYDFTIEESSDDELDSPEEFEDFDFLIFDKLEYSRDRLFKVASGHSLPLLKRLLIIKQAALKLQELYDEGDIFSMDSVAIDSSILDSSVTFSSEYCIKSLDVLLDMEVLEDAWTKDIMTTRDYWIGHDITCPDSHSSIIYEKILKSLLFTYFCGSVYDGQIYARAMIAVMSTIWIMMISDAHGDTPLNEIIYLYSREVEHSDINVNSLIEFFENELN